MSKVKDRETNLKEARNKCVTTYKGTPISKLRISQQKSWRRGGSGTIDLKCYEGKLQTKNTITDTILQKWRGKHIPRKTIAEGVNHHWNCLTNNARGISYIWKRRILSNLSNNMKTYGNRKQTGKIHIQSHSEYFNILVHSKSPLAIIKLRWKYKK